MLYENKRYKVVLTDSLEEIEFEQSDNYAVVNKENGCIEGVTQNLPQALTFCDQFDVIIASGLHQQWAEGQAVTDTFFAPPRDSDESLN